MCARVCVCVCARALSRFSHFQLCETVWTVARQAPLSTGLSRQNTAVGCHGNLANPGIEPKSLLCPALAGRFFTTFATWEAPEVEHTTSLWPSYSIAKYLTKKWNHMFKDWDMIVYGNFIFSCQNLENNQCPIPGESVNYGIPIRWNTTQQ